MNEDLSRKIRQWYVRAGSPTVRTIARDSGVSSTTVHDTISGTRTPRWQTLAPVIDAIGGDVEEARELYEGTKPPERDPELRTLTQCTALLAMLSDEQRHRVLGFLNGKFGAAAGVM